MSLDTLTAALKRDEGRNLNVRGRHILYKCPADKWTIGYGRNLEDNGLSEREATDLLVSDIIQAQRDAAVLIPNWLSLDDVRQDVVANMAFNLGRERLSKFGRFLAAVNEKRHIDAAYEMKNSKWYGQVGHRAVRLTHEYLTGKLDR